MTVVEKKALVRGNVLIAGVDVAKKKHFARVNDGFGDELAKPFGFRNNMTGFEALESKLLRLQDKSGAERIVVGMEPTGHYWKPLAWWLTERGFIVVIVNPMAVKRHKEDLDNSPSKSDRKDTAVIADLVAQGKFMQALLPRGVYAELRGLAVTRRQQKSKLNAAKCNVQAILDEFFPEFTVVFKDPYGMAASWVLEHCPMPGQILEIPIEEIAEALKETSNGRVGMKRAQRLREVAQRSVGVPQGTEAARLRMQSAIREVRFWQAEVEQTETAMKCTLEETGLKEFVTSIPGIGVVTAAAVLGEMGDPANYESARQVQKLAGLNVIENSSGQHKGKTTISKRGRAGLRCVLYQAAFRLVAVNAEFKALYEYLTHRPHNPLKKKAALVVVGLKLLRVMFGLIQKKEVYDPQKALGECRQAQLRAVA